MQRGIDLEGVAVEHFLMHYRDLSGNEIELDNGGFVTTADGRFGCSPDRIVKRTGGNEPFEAVEIKAPAPWTHVGYLIDGLGDSYQAQVQGQLLVGGFDAVHFYSYHPEFPSYHQYTPRKEGYITRLRVHLLTFQRELEEAEEKLKNLSGWP
jgi:hypothetical protein